jgi:hypothetical protein
VLGALLPQPGGFEGFGLTRECAPPDGLPIAPLRDEPLHLFDGRVALDALAAKALPRTGHVSKITYLLDL